MKKWKIPVTWEVCGIVECEAPTLEEAMEYARDEDGVIPLPTESDYWKEAGDCLMRQTRRKPSENAGMTARKMM